MITTVPGLASPGTLRSSSNGRGAHESNRNVGPDTDQSGPSQAQLPVREPVLLEMDQVTPRQVKFLWKGIVPLGMVSLLDGDPKLGKSTLTSLLATHVSTGEPLPGGGHLNEPAGVVLLSAEEDPQAVIAPRLRAMGAALGRIALLTAWRDAIDEERIPTLPFDVDVLKKAIERKDAKLLVIDPLMSYLDAEINSHKDQDVRRALHPLKLLAEATGAAIVIVRHLNKSPGGPAIYRGGGSIGIAAGARSVMLLAKHPEDEEQRVLAVVGGNLAVDVVPRSFRIRGAPVPGLVNEDGSPVTAATIEWGEETGHSADELLSHHAGRPAPKLEAALELLRRELSGGQRLRSDIEAVARDEDISWRTVVAAKAELEVVSTQPRVEGQRGAGPSWWSLPNRDASSTHQTDCTPNPERIHAGHGQDSSEPRIRNAATFRCAEPVAYQTDGRLGQPPEDDHDSIAGSTRDRKV